MQTVDVSELNDEQKQFIAQLVQFLKTQKQSTSGVPLEEVGFTKEQAANLRARLSIFEADWNASGMEAYDKL